MKQKRRPAVGIPEEAAAPLREFSKATGIPQSKIATLAIAFGVEKLIKGEMAIINGQLVRTGEATQKAA